MRMNDAVYIKVRSVCSVKATRSRSRCAGDPHSCCSWFRVSPVSTLALNISGQNNKKKTPPPSPRVSKLSPQERQSSSFLTIQHGWLDNRPTVAFEGQCSLRWTRVWRRKSSGSHPVCPCALWLSVSRVPHLLYYAVSWVAPFAVFKASDVFMSLIQKLLTEINSSHVGTVCWLRVIPHCLVLFACDEGGKWTPATKCQ